MKRSHLASGIVIRMFGLCTAGGLILGGIYGVLLVLIRISSVVSALSRENYDYVGLVVSATVLLPMGGLFGLFFGALAGSVLGLAYGLILATAAMLRPQLLIQAMSHSRAVGVTVAIITALVLAVGLPVALGYDRRLPFGSDGSFAFTGLVPALIAGVWCWWCVSRVLTWVWLQQEQLYTSVQSM